MSNISSVNSISHRVQNLNYQLNATEEKNPSPSNGELAIQPIHHSLYKRDTDNSVKNQNLDKKTISSNSESYKLYQRYFAGSYIPSRF